MNTVVDIYRGRKMTAWTIAAVVGIAIVLANLFVQEEKSGYKTGWPIVYEQQHVIIIDRSYPRDDFVDFFRPYNIVINACLGMATVGATFLTAKQILSHSSIRLRYSLRSLFVVATLFAVAIVLAQQIPLGLFLSVPVTIGISCLCFTCGCAMRKAVGRIRAGR